jgi:hypothetical protein
MVRANAVVHRTLRTHEADAGVVAADFHTAPKPPPAKKKTEP